MSFTWVPFYREVAERVLEYEDRQSDLLAILCEMKAAGLPTISFVDELPDDVILPFAEIDPFTFMAIFSSADIEDSKKKCLWLKNQWKLQADNIEDFDGRVSAEAHNPGFWALDEDEDWELESNRSLWQLASQAFAGDIDAIDAELFSHCINKCSIDIQKITTGLSWINPAKFLSSTSFVISFVKSNKSSFNVEDSDVSSLSDYHKFLESARKANLDFVALSHEARLAKFGEKNEIEVPDEKDQIHQMVTPTDFPLNQILYGPPGTGKTYNTIERAVEIITGENLPHAAAKARFDELRANGQIEFVTFHQSFSYEEFIEGLRPILDEKGDGAAPYKVRDGVLKTLALRATEHEFLHVQYPITCFNDAWQNLIEKLDNNSTMIVGWAASHARFQLSRRGNEISGSSVDGKNKYPCERDLMRELWDRFPLGTTINNATISTAASELGRRCFPNFINALLTEMRKWSLGERKIQQRYVLIVDEINRGNISKILGELITLLEPDKRIGAANELRVQLPVSGETFALPPNLYLLGTMNTADKSLALLDIALRRRFDFIEMAPDNSLFPDFARAVLIQLNLRLEVALDREHRIGHAYFIHCENKGDFNAVFRAKILPLLQEFFYNDWETLRAVLGESGDKNGAFIVKLEAPTGMKARTKWRWWFDVDGAANFDFLDKLKANYN